MDDRPCGAELAGAFHSDLVRPLLARAMPRLRYAAARLGSGSDVLGLDDAMSRDHDWGCRLTLLVDDARSTPTTWRSRPSPGSRAAASAWTRPAASPSWTGCA
ncbi:hypothetical protein [Actinomadura rubrisoli]|uniref:hypothetical protein n=1 Tax=Actinomadura rubrisoli TaxID=2530368 RepID=UPI001A9F822F|nr:hypothetical protein [Actinomadura rubrisoli]